MHRIRSTALLAALTLFGAACHDGTQPAAVSTEEPAALTQMEGYPARGELREGWILDRRGNPMRVTFEVHEGRAIWQGDIDLGPADRVARTEAELRRPDGPRMGVIIDAAARRWPGGVVPYVIDASLPSQTRVTDAIAHIEANTDWVDFVPRTTQADYVRVVPSTGCSSAVGRQGGVQNLNLAGTCSTGNTIHEFLHALGMHHEQSRCDRGSFVTIQWANVQSGTEHNFTAQCDNYTDVFAYNEGSIMHYGPTAFSVNGQPTIVSLRGLDWQMGQRTGMAGTDISTVDLMYPRPFNASISGKTYVTLHESAQYTANVVGGTAPFTYEWRSRQSGPYTSGTWSGWFSTGSSNYTYASIHSCGLNTNYLETRVTDATGRQTTASITISITNPC